MSDLQKKLLKALIVGKPNVGKSTLLNFLVGEKVSIVSRKAQTTQKNITGVITKDDSQFIFFDTPGLNKICLLYTSPSPRDRTRSRMPSSA